MPAKSETISKPGFWERFSFISRNVEAVAAAVAILLGNLGAAALLGLGSVIDHAAGEHFKSSRLKSQPA